MQYTDEATGAMNLVRQWLPTDWYSRLQKGAEGLARAFYRETVTVEDVKRMLQVVILQKGN